MAVVHGSRAATKYAPAAQQLAAEFLALRILTAIADLCILLIVMGVAWRTRILFEGEALPKGLGIPMVQTGPAIAVTWLVVLAWQGAYSPRTFGEGLGEFRAVGLGSVMTAGLVAIACYMLVVPLPRSFLLVGFLLGTALLVLSRCPLRLVLYQQRRKGRPMHRVIAVGDPAGVGEVVDALRQSKYVGYEVVGAAVPDGIAMERFPVPVLGDVRQTRQLCSTVGADTILVTRGGFATARELRRVAWDLEGSSIQLVIVPSLNEVAGSRIHMRPVAGLPLLHLEQPQADEAGGLSKRLFDIVGATVALLLLSPVMALVALAIVATDRGPAIFRQQRIGRDGQLFDCYKFRSMCVDAQRMEPELRQATGQGSALWKMKRDPRLTPVGGFIRRYSLDELPQLVNVLRGEMSLVGPRPQQRWEVDTYTPWEHRRLRVRPGMTGLWQVSGRSQLSFDEAIRLDLYYVDNWSMTADLIIMARTITAVFGKTGAY